jgi:hypothetical protein
MGLVGANFEDIPRPGQVVMAPPTDNFFLLSSLGIIIGLSTIGATDFNLFVFHCSFTSTLFYILMAEAAKNKNRQDLE